MKVMQISSLEGLSPKLRKKGLLGISSTETWVCPMGRDPSKLSKKQLAATCRQVTVAEVKGVKRAAKPRKTRSKARRRRR